MKGKGELQKLHHHCKHRMIDKGMLLPQNRITANIAKTKGGNRENVITYIGKDI